MGFSNISHTTIGATVNVHGFTNVAEPWMAKSDHFCALRQYERMESGGVTALLSLLPK